MRQPFAVMTGRVLLSIACCSAAGAVVAAVPATEFDDCDAKFIAFIGANTYQFSPQLAGELGKVRLYTILSYQEATATGRFGDGYWKLEIRGPRGVDQLVRTAHGVVRIDHEGAALAEFRWDGRDARGTLVPPGKYRYTFKGRFLADAIPHRHAAGDYDALEAFPEIHEAFASTGEVIVNYDLDVATSLDLRASLLQTSCQLPQNLPLETSFPYNFYYGSTHSHSNFSDGGQPTTACSSGNAYGSGTFGPAAVYDFARNTAGMDYWVINEHNHLINDSVVTNNPPVTEAKVKQRYADGLAAANAATAAGSFVALYGMEFGVLTNADQGHVTVIESPKLFGWETCTTCNGPNPECTPGTDCYFDVFVPKRYGYLTLYQRSVENPSPAGPLGIFCHPSATHFDNFAFNANADAALQGIAVRSGLAFTTAGDCANANVGATDYSLQWLSALNRGFHVGPTADHDAHCNNFGIANPVRTVYLLPNAVSPALTKTAWLQAHKARHFFASEDSNAQLVFATSDNSHIMGDIFSVGSSATLRASIYDPNGESVSTLELWRGQIGAGALTAAYQSWANQSSFAITENLTSGTYYYFVHAVQADGHNIWSSPMWITYGSGPTTYSISGNAGTGGATVSAGTASTTADASGNYTISGLAAGTYTVTPSKTGCTFSPASLSVTVGPDATAKNFTATCPTPTYSISGNAGTGGATVSAGTASTTADASGNYTISGLAAATYTVTPSKTGCTFSPASLSVTVGPDATAKNFTATCPPPTYSISGNAGTGGATVSAGTASTTADASGNYTISGLAAATYTVTPSKTGCTFSPASLSVTVGPDATAKNFTATCGTGDTQLTSGVTITGQSVALKAWKYYYIAVPAGAGSLVLKTTSATADVDIYTQFGAKPTSSSYVCRPYTSSGNETCTQTNPSAGTWWLGVYGYAAGSFSVTGTVSMPLVERLANGGFESITASTNAAPDGSWTRTAYTGNSFNTLLANATYPHSGTDHAYLGVNASTSSQTLDSAAVTLPAGATSATFSFWVSIVTNETGTTPYDTLAVQLVGPTGTVLTTLTTLSNANSTAGAGSYVQKSFDVTSFKGQTVKVRFLANTDSSRATYFRVDDVSLKSDG